MITSFIGRETILIGNAVYTSLRALQLRHFKIIDTAFIFKDPSSSQAIDITGKVYTRLVILKVRRNIQQIYDFL